MARATASIGSVRLARQYVIRRIDSLVTDSFPMIFSGRNDGALSGLPGPATSKHGTIFSAGGDSYGLGLLGLS